MSTSRYIAGLAIGIFAFGQATYATKLDLTKNKLSVYYAQNIGSTLYAKTGETPNFAYKPEIVFKNISGDTVNIANVKIAEGAGFSNITYTCNGTAAETAACTLPAGAQYIIKGALEPVATINTTKTLAITVNSSKETLGTYEKKMLFVKYLPDHVALRVINHDKTLPVYLAAAYGGNMVKFDKDTGIGTVESKAGANYKDDQFKFAQNNDHGSEGGIVYFPYGASGTYLITRAKDGFQTTYRPSSTDPNSPPFLLGEFTYLNQPGTKPCSADQNCERLVVDQSYVNGIAMLAVTETMGEAAPLGGIASTQDATFGIKPAAAHLTTAEMFAAVKTEFDGFGSPWKHVAADGLKNLIQEDGGSITEVLAPIQVQGVASYNPFPSDYYNDYVNALWKYLEDTPIYVDASGVSSDCIVKGQVDKQTQKLNFSPVNANQCKAKGKSILGTMKGNKCGPKEDQLCADTANLSFAKFNNCDFLLAAGSAACHGDATTAKTFFDNEALWGPNGTYRAVVGRAIAAYQAIGLLPICSKTDPSSAEHPMNSEDAVRRVNKTDSVAFQNPSCLSNNKYSYTSDKLTYNGYVKAFSKYVNAYTYSYGDFLQSDGTITYFRGGLKEPTFNDLPRAMPVTVELF